MQLMAENMEGIMQMIAHRLDTIEKGGYQSSKEMEEQRVRCGRVFLKFTGGFGQSLRRNRKDMRLGEGDSSARDSGRED